jgi:hypothetical protein
VNIVFFLHQRWYILISLSHCLSSDIEIETEPSSDEEVEEEEEEKAEEEPGLEALMKPKPESTTLTPSSSGTALAAQVCARSLQVTLSSCCVAEDLLHVLK